MNMNLKPFEFAKPANRPFLYTSFVSTIDGKIIVKEKGYWPIGTENDKEMFTYLRAHADAIVDAKNTALRFGKYFIRRIHEDMYQGFRRELGKTGMPEYIVLTSSPDEELARVLKNEHNFRPTVLTTAEGEQVRETCNVKRVSSEENDGRVSTQTFINYLNEQGHKIVFVDGGPTLIAQLLQDKVLDEIHLTITPKIFGSTPGKTLTMVEGILFPPDKVPQFELVSVEKLDDEVVLRYQTPVGLTNP